MRIGLYGGSFDPFHAGHLEPVRAARDRLALARVVYLPTARPPHKPGREMAAAHHRYTMAELALLDHPDLVVSPFELTPGRSAYTVETVRHFRSLHPDDELFLLIGADSLAEFETWRAWEEIVDTVRLAVLDRPGWALERVLPDLPPRLRELANRGALLSIDNPPVDVSSTRLRELLAAGKAPPDGWMSDRVLQYVRKYCLYR